MKQRFAQAFLLSGIATLTIAQPAQALNFNETVDGDLPNNNPAHSVLTLDPGLNTISGSTGAPVLDFPDNFTIAGPAPTSFVLSAYAPGPSNSASTFRVFRISDGSNVDSLSNMSAGNVGLDYLPEINSIFTANSLDFSTAYLRITEGDGPATWTFEVQAVPFEFEASLGLMALGAMFGGYVLNKKRKNKQLAA
jgi:hypothetical protein